MCFHTHTYTHIQYILYIYVDKQIDRQIDEPVRFSVCLHIEIMVIVQPWSAALQWRMRGSHLGTGSHVIPVVQYMFLLQYVELSLTTTGKI